MHYNFYFVDYQLVAIRLLLVAIVLLFCLYWLLFVNVLVVFDIQKRWFTTLLFPISAAKIQHFFRTCKTFVLLQTKNTANLYNLYSQLHCKQPW